MKPFCYRSVMASLLLVSATAGAQEVPGRLAAPDLVEAAFNVAHRDAATADSAASVRAFGWKILPETHAYTEWIDRDRAVKGSVSLGSVGSGTLKQGVQLPVEGPHHQVIERHRHYETQWGTQELVDLLLFAAEFVDTRSPGAPLRIGNLSRRDGGDIRWSHSHNSGRDADIAFFVTDEAGQSVVTPELLQFDENGIPTGRPDLRFDVNRNWLFIKGLVSKLDVVIQYVFVSEPLKAMLLRHATAIGEPADVLMRATDILHQPTDALPHDDHFHLRIACPLQDRLLGCLDSGPQWAWADWHEDALRAQALELARGMMADSAAVRLASLNYLEEMRSPFMADIALGVGIWSEDTKLRQRSLEIAQSAWSWSGFAIAQAERLILTPTTTADEKNIAYTILRRSVDEESRDFALQRLTDATVDEDERVLAARTLGHFMDESLVPQLMAQLVTQPPRVRAEIAEVLMRIVNYGPEIDWRSSSNAACERAVSQWQNWTQQHGDGRDSWLLAGFKQQGFDITDLEAPAVDTMMPKLSTAPPYIAYNVNHIMRRVTGRWAPLELTDGRRLYEYWSKWWKRNRDRVIARRDDSGEKQGE